MTLIDSASQGILFFTSIPTIAGRDFYHYRGEFSFDSLYQKVEARLSFDSRLENNSILFHVPGGEYPPLQLNEIMPAPTSNLNSEWIEIKNNQAAPYDIADWKLKIGEDEILITEWETIVEANDYLVIVQDSILFSDFYFDDQINFIQPSSWVVLKNSVDTIVLIDNYQIEASRHIYSVTFENNISLARDEQSTAENVWGQSANIGGSPGKENITLLQPNAFEIEIALSTKTISPDNDGIDDFTVISIDAPISESYSLKIFDRFGRVVRQFFNQQQYIPTTIVWDGKDDSRRLVPIGIYIIYFEASPNYKSKTTVVVAR